MRIVEEDRSEGEEMIWKENKEEEEEQKNRREDGKG